MRGISKKMLISLLTTLVVFITVFATTYAWVGIFTYAKSDSFKMNLMVTKTNNYYLIISGKDSSNVDDYDDHVPLQLIQEQVLRNMGYNISDNETSNYINSEYERRTNIQSVTPFFDSNKNILGFKKMLNLSCGPIDFEETNKVIKFDIYLSVDTIEGVDENTTGINSNVALDNLTDTLVGTMNEYVLINGNTIRKNRYAPSTFNWKLYEAHKNLSVLTYDDFGNEKIIDKTSILMNSANASRFALEVYNPVKFTDSYTGDETPIKTIIYQGGNKYPVYNAENNYCDMGGILSEEYNFGIQEANSTYFRNLVIPEETLEYETKVRTLTGSKIENCIWNTPPKNEIDTENINYLGVENGIRTKIKISVYFWFEGWDSDCTWAIDLKKVTLNLSLTADIDI